MSLETSSQRVADGTWWVNAPAPSLLRWGNPDIFHPGFLSSQQDKAPATHSSHSSHNAPQRPFPFGLASEAVVTASLSHHFLHLPNKPLDLQSLSQCLLHGKPSLIKAFAFFLTGSTWTLEPFYWYHLPPPGPGSCTPHPQAPDKSCYELNSPGMHHLTCLTVGASVSEPLPGLPHSLGQCCGGQTHLKVGF